MNRSIAFFDFDGTITFKDTMLELALFHRGYVTYGAGFLTLMPAMLGMKAGWISNNRVKEAFLTKFFGGIGESEFNDLASRFAAQKIPQLLRPEAMQTIDSYRRTQTEVIIVSASAEDWIAPWCRSQNLPYLATRLEKKEGKITGRLFGANCYGEEKVRRIREAYPLDSYTDIYCYGDSSGDRPMLSLATESFYKPFR